MLYANGEVDKYPKAEAARVNAHAWANYSNDETEAFGFYLQKGLFEEYRKFGLGKGKDLGDVRPLSQGARAALAGG